MESLTPFTMKENGTLIEAVKKIDQNRSRAVIVLSGEKVIGIISEGDIMRALLKGANLHAPISSFMVYSFKFLKEREMNLAYQMVKKHLFTLVPVVDQDLKLVDVITLRDVLEHLNSGSSH